MSANTQFKLCLAVLVGSCIAWGWLTGQAAAAEPIRIGYGDTCSSTRIVDGVRGSTIVIERCYPTRPAASGFFHDLLVRLGQPCTFRKPCPVRR